MRKRGILFDLDGTLINTYNNFDYSLIFKELNQTQKDLLLDILKKRIHSFAEMEKKVRLECTNKQEGEDLIQKIHAYPLQRSRTQKGCIKISSSCERERLYSLFMHE